MNKELLKLFRSADPENSAMLADLSACLKEMETELDEICGCRNQTLSKDLTRVVKSGGKRLRPVLVYLGYAVGKEDENRKDTDYPVVPLMTALELIHTASLIHDDIIDLATVRRNVPTINATSGDYAAIQAGDYLLAKAARLAKHYKGLKTDRHFAMTAKEMCIAEFMQMNSEYLLDGNSLDNYFEQIKRKTAALIAAAVSLGGAAAGASDETVNLLDEYGKNVGLAFQIRDDVLDFVSDKDFGKKCGQDLLRGIFTLPLILALTTPGNLSETQRLEARKLALAKTKTEEELQKLLLFVKSSGAIEKAQEVIEKYTTRAAEALEGIRECEAKDALLDLASGLAVRCI